MIPDVSHGSDALFYDVCKIAKKPFVASHSNARSIYDRSRNMTDDMIRMLAERGGVIGMNFFAGFTSSRSREDGMCYLEDILQHPELKILATSPDAGVYALATEGGRQVFITGHSEYDALTLKAEYDRDKAQGLPIRVPANYFPNDDDTKMPLVTWRSHANLLYTNWLNYYVYQRTPYIIGDIALEKFTID